MSVKIENLRQRNWRAAHCLSNKEHMEKVALFTAPSLELLPFWSRPVVPISLVRRSLSILASPSPLICSSKHFIIHGMSKRSCQRIIPRYLMVLFQSYMYHHRICGSHSEMWIFKISLFLSERGEKLTLKILNVYRTSRQQNGTMLRSLVIEFFWLRGHRPRQIHQKLLAILQNDA
jgi:hypothetical protein